MKEYPAEATPATWWPVYTRQPAALKQRMRRHCGALGGSQDGFGIRKDSFA
jgi:hypothetical protein